MTQSDIVFDSFISDNIETKIAILDIMFLDITLCRQDNIFLFGRGNPGFGRAEFIGPGRFDLDKDDRIADLADYIDLLALKTIALFQNLIAFIGKIFDRQTLGLAAELARPRVSQE